ncbi:GNAT family N-acetyltransferase [Terrilactibacillus sp. BCM23-1]|uniref:GNAT family N-acetyltransferase n=1 Tax=Terrilactibacillus tamarindi TaxID=2599694 RepID=A0A6N8CQ52_9BACI|nr:GNAT family N-acetyltransferase [Terrilactibacillus tamarindi]MTT31233.1 GNAT family N-acetyltransferase [Terrilactibacillus tamarindi]
MLIRYKKSYEKIAMGLLSFVPTEKDIKKLQKTIKKYEENDDWQLFLWKDEDDILGAVGIHLEEDKAIIEHVSVNPSYRHQGIGKTMLKALNQMLSQEGIPIVPQKKIEEFVDKCLKEAKKDANENTEETE